MALSWVWRCPRSLPFTNSRSDWRIVAWLPKLLAPAKRYAMEELSLSHQAANPDLCGSQPADKDLVSVFDGVELQRFQAVVDLNLFALQLRKDKCRFRESLPLL